MFWMGVFRLNFMPFDKRIRSIFEPMAVKLNRMTQISDEVFGTSSKTEYDHATIQLFMYADLTYKICTRLKDQIEAMITPNAVKRVAKRISGDFKLSPFIDQQRSEKLASTVAACAVDLPGTNLSVTLSQCAPSYWSLGQSEYEFAAKVQSEVLSVIKNFLTSHWSEIQKERSKLDLLRVDYDWARNEKGKKVDENKVAMAKQAFDRQLYRTQLLLHQCKATGEEIANGLAAMAAAQWQHFKHCEEIMLRLNTEVNSESLLQQ